MYGGGSTPGPGAGTTTTTPPPPAAPPSSTPHNGALRENIFKNGAIKSTWQEKGNPVWPVGGVAVNSFFLAHQHSRLFKQHPLAFLEVHKPSLHEVHSFAFRDITLEDKNILY